MSRHLKQYLQYTASDYVALSLGIAVVSIAFVFTPMAIRSIVDGFLTSQDLHAILLAIGIILSIEVLAFLSSYSINWICDQKTTSMNTQIQSAALNKIYSHREQSEQQKIEDFLLRDAVTLSTLKNKIHWLRIKDMVVLSVLSLVAIKLSPVTGFIIFGLLAFQALAAFILQSKIKSDAWQISYKEREIAGTVKADSSNIDQLIDIGFHKSRLSFVQKNIYNTNESKYSLGRFRALLDESVKSTRTIGLLLMIGGMSFLGDIQQLSMGTVWGLMIIFYRINGPIQTLSQWSFNSRKDKNLEKRVIAFMNALPEESTTQAVKKFKKHLDALEGSNHIIWCLDQNLETLLEACRKWSDRLRKTHKILVFDQNMPMDFDQESVSLALMILDHKSKKESLERFISELKAEKKIIIVNKTALWPNIMWAQDQFIVESNSLITLDNKNTSLLLKKHRLFSTAFDLLCRDVDRVCRFQTPIQVIYLNLDYESHSTKLKPLLRQYDHMVPHPQGGILLCFVNCPSSDLHIPIARIQSALNKNPEYQAVFSYDALKLEFDRHFANEFISAYAEFIFKGQTLNKSEQAA